MALRGRKATAQQRQYPNSMGGHVNKWGAVGTYLLRVGERFGFPAMITLIVTLAGGALCSWLGPNVIIPMRDRHFQYLDKVEMSMAQQKEASDKQSHKIDAVLEGLKINNETQKEGIASQKELTRAIRARIRIEESKTMEMR